MNKQRYIFFIIAIIGINFISGCISSDVRYIGNFMASVEKNNIEARFSLMDSSKNYVSADGTGQVRIVNSDGETVYTGTINVNKEDFREYTLLLLPDQKFLAYAWKIPLSEIKKSISSDGTMYIEFKTNNAKFQEIETSILWGLPTYSEEELEQLNEEDFSKSAMTVNKKLSKGSFEVTVKRVGFFTPLKKWGDKKEYFRIDIAVKNIGKESEYFVSRSLFILDEQGNQYEKEYGGTLDISESYIFAEKIYPNAQKSGYILFKKLPKNSQSVKLFLELGRDEDYNPYTFEFDIPFTR